jgi:hypothetical protein
MIRQARQFGGWHRHLLTETGWTKDANGRAAAGPSAWWGRSGLIGVVLLGGNSVITIVSLLALLVKVVSSLRWRRHHTNVSLLLSDTD